MFEFRREPMFEFRRSRCSSSEGAGVRVQKEPVFEFRRSRCSSAEGIGVRVEKEPVFEMRGIRATHRPQERASVVPVRTDLVAAPLIRPA